MSEKKPWCEYSGDTACNCSEGECWAGQNKGQIDKLNMLFGYGLSIEEVGEDMQEPRP